LFGAEQNVSLTECWLEHNRASSLGGALFASSCSNVFINTTTFAHNHIDPFFGDFSAARVAALNPDTTGGGAIYAEVSSLSLSQTVFTGNTVWAVGRGGSVRTLFSWLTGQDVAFVNNSAAGGGGALSAEIGSLVSLRAPLLVRANVVGQASRLLSGEAVAAISRAAVQQLRADAVSFGGGFFVSAAHAFDLATATNNSLSSALSTSSPILFDNNQADYGGALYITQSLPASLCVFVVVAEVSTLFCLSCMCLVLIVSRQKRRAVLQQFGSSRRRCHDGAQIDCRHEQRQRHRQQGSGRRSSFDCSTP
jgi:predicted outer membrane repeat protein